MSPLTNIKLFVFSCSTFLYLKFLLVWALVLMADFLLEFRFEYLWPFWLLIRSVYDSFKYQGLVSTGSAEHVPAFGAIQVLRNVFFWKLDPHPPPCTANNVKPYTFVTLFPIKIDHPHLRYVTLEWPLCR